MIGNRRSVVAIALGGWLALVGTWLGTASVFAATENWVATWACAPQLVEARNLPPQPGLSDSTLRQVVHMSIGGRRLRARFSNAFGDAPLTIESVHVAFSSGGSAVLAGSDKALAFRGLAAVTILPGKAVWSDAFDFDLAALTNFAVTIRFGETPAAVTGHPGSRATSYLRRGDAVTVLDMAGAAAVQHWYVLTGIDAAVDTGGAAVVALGDSITDGRGSTTDGNNRWTDDLGLRLAGVERPLKTAVVNEGIGGNAVLAGGAGADGNGAV